MAISTRKKNCGNCGQAGHQNADVLYVTFETIPPDDYQFVENEFGDVVKVDRVNQRVVGCTIPFFMAKARKRKIFIPEVGGVSFNAISKRSPIAIKGNRDGRRLVAWVRRADAPMVF
jgi:hypothetical protein